ncbi:MAG: YbaB/EbfC family nucleoid-associated protein [bacterium]|nr:YbaB/EbfC family nucleoid-associated protein [bacterium]
MFNKLKQVKNLRSQAKQMQNVLGQESVTTERNGIKMVMNGNMEVTEFTAEDNISKEALIQLTPDIVNNSIKNVQKIMARKMQEMGGFPGLS